MNGLRISSWRGLTPWMALGATMGLYQLTAAQQQTPASQDGLEILTRGPGHEAFAETISPSTVINLSVFAQHLFLRPGYGHFYFRDYYSANYTNQGFSPWFSYQSSHRGYDPIYANQSWQNRHDHGIVVGPRRRQFSRSPFVAQPTDQLTKNNRPPQRHEDLKPDPRVQPPTQFLGGPPRTLPSSRPGRGDAARNEQTQVNSQSQKSQRVNQGQGASDGQTRGRGENRGKNGQSTSNGKQKGSSQNNQSDKAKN